MAAAAISLAIYATLTLIVLGRADHLPRGVAIFVLLAAGFGTLALLAIHGHPHNRAVWVPAWAALLSGIATAGSATATLIAELAGLEMSATTWDRLSPSEIPLAAAIGYEFFMLAPGTTWFLMLTLWLLLFPNGELPSSRWRSVAWGALATMASLTGALLWVYRPESTVRYGETSTRLPGIGVLVQPLYLLLVLLSGLCFVAFVRRYRHSTGDARPQFRWVLLGTAAMYFAVFVVDERPLLLLAAVLGVSISVACYVVAVTKYRLYDIDLVISRTLVYGTLAVFIGVVYVIVVVVVGGMLGSGAENIVLSILATALVAVLLEPIRQRLQRWANRLVYGTRATPYEVLSDLNPRLGEAEPAQGVLERMVRLMAEGIGAEQAAVWVGDSDGLAAAVGWPDLPAPSKVVDIDELAGVSFPVIHDEELVGALQVIKSRGNPITPTEQQLLADLAGSAGLVLGNQRLNAALAARAAELRASRRRLVDMQDTERRRLERNLHDGAQQQVVAMKLKLSLAEQMALKEGAEEMAQQLAGLAEEAQQAVDEIRSLARGIYPPLLQSEGVVAAIKAHAAAAAIPVVVTSEGIDRYPKDVESAIYFAAVEATANAVRHGDPSRIAIALQVTTEVLTLEVSDDGTGFDTDSHHEGMGLTNTRDRVEAVGGEMLVSSSPGKGTSVSVEVPLDRAEFVFEEGPAESHTVANSLIQ